MSSQSFILDKSALLAGVTERVNDGTINGRILVHDVLLRQIEKERKRGTVSGEIASHELLRLKETTEKFLLPLEIVSGEKGSSISDTIRRYSLRFGTSLVTADPVQKSIAEIMGIKCLFIEPKITRLSFEDYFDKDTMSVHLKEMSPPRAKRGRPGKWEFVYLSDKPLSNRDMETVVSEILRATRIWSSSFVEIERRGSMIVQLSDYRIVITRTPLSEGWEVTIVKPVTRKTLEDYNLAPEVKARLTEKAEGIVIAGSPGMGKTTFAQALAESYSRSGKIVKTIETPRDMHLPPEVTQYSKNYAELGELHDILLLSRPDYTFFDEMRNDEDFRLYIDLRLAGIGMVGVVHATSPLDAIHRFLNRSDLGTIPNIVDTVVFIKNGEVQKVYSLGITVKVPAGLKDNDLARPVVEVKDFLSQETEYEIYVFGEQTMIIPVKGVTKGKSPVQERIQRLVSKYVPDSEVKIEGDTIIIEIPRRDLPKYNRKVANQMRKIEKKTGMKIRIKMDTDVENR